MVRQGDSIPHFMVTDASGARRRYADIWQRKHLVLVALTAGDAALAAHYQAGIQVDPGDAALVVTADPIPRIPSPAVIVADRWGEVAFSAFASSAGELPDAGEIVAWLHFVQMQCPECQGEAR